MELEEVVSTDGREAHLITGQYFTHTDVFFKARYKFPSKILNTS